MDFCPKCNSLLKPNKTSQGLFLNCSCGYSRKANIKEHKEIITNKQDDRGIATDIHPLAVYEHLVDDENKSC